MEYKAEIDIMPLDAILDPQGKAVTGGLHNLGLKAISNVRIGKHITLHIEADSRSEAEKMVEEACRRLLANQVMEKYSYRVEEVATEPK